MAGAEQPVQLSAKEIPRHGGVGDESGGFPLGVLLQPFACGTTSASTSSRAPARCGSCDAAASSACTIRSNGSWICAVCDAPNASAALASGSSQPLPETADLGRFADFLHNQPACALSKPLVILLVDEELARMQPEAVATSLGTAVESAPKNCLISLLSFSKQCVHLHRLNSSLPMADVFCPADLEMPQHHNGAAARSRGMRSSAQSKLDAFIQGGCFTKYVKSAHAASAALNASFRTIGASMSSDEDADACVDFALSVAERLFHAVDVNDGYVERSRRALLVACDSEALHLHIKNLRLAAISLLKARACLDALVYTQCRTHASVGEAASPSASSSWYKLHHLLAVAADSTGGSLWNFASLEDKHLAELLAGLIASDRAIRCTATVRCSHIVQIEQAVGATVDDHVEATEQRVSFPIASQSAWESLAVELKVPRLSRKRRQPKTACVQLEIDGVLGDRRGAEGELLERFTRFATVTFEIGTDAQRSPLDARLGAVLLGKMITSEHAFTSQNDAEKWRTRVGTLIRSVATAHGERCNDDQGTIGRLIRKREYYVPEVLAHFTWLGYCFQRSRLLLQTSQSYADSASAKSLIRILPVEPSYRVIAPLLYALRSDSMEDGEEVRVPMASLSHSKPYVLDAGVELICWVGNSCSEAVQNAAFHFANRVASARRPIPQVYSSNDCTGASLLDMASLYAKEPWFGKQGDYKSWLHKLRLRESNSLEGV